MLIKSIIMICKFISHSSLLLKTLLAAELLRTLATCGLSIMVLFWLSSASIAGVNSDLPTRSGIQNQWDTLAKQKDISPDEKQV